MKYNLLRLLNTLFLLAGITGLLSGQNVGDRISVRWKKKWYPARVLRVRDGKYRIRYIGYASSWDEWVVPERIRTLFNSTPASRWKEYKYAILIKRSTYADAAWARVANALKVKHGGRIYLYNSKVDETLGGLRQYFPHYICFVAKPLDAGPSFVNRVSRFTRQLDADPYTDAIWAILTGYNAKDALRIARHKTPLRVKYGVAAMLSWLERVPAGIAFFEGYRGYSNKGSYQTKQRGEPVVHHPKGMEEHASVLVKQVNRNRVDAVWTSGHASERSWHPYYPTGPGYFYSSQGSLFLKENGRRYTVNSINPKIYLGIGNCLIGKITGTSAMSLAWMRAGGVNQFFGYFVPSYYGFMGWGLGHYFFTLNGKFSLAESFYLANNCQVFQINKLNLQGYHKRGMRYEVNSTVLYGDPAWDARVGQDSAVAKPAWSSVFHKRKSGRRSVYSLRVHFNKGMGNSPGKNLRPVFEFLPVRLKNIRIAKVSSNVESYVVTDNFVILKLKGSSISAGTDCSITFSGVAVD